MSLELLLLFYLFLFFDFIHYLLILDELLSLVFLADRFVDDVSLLLKDADAAEQIIVLKVRASLLALVVQATVLIVLRAFLAVEVPIIEHVDLDEIHHFVVHNFALAYLKRQVLVILVVLRGLRVFANVVEDQLGIVVHDVGANSNEAQLLSAVHDVSRVAFVDLRRDVEVCIVVNSIFVVCCLHHGRRRLRLIALTITFVNLQFIVKVYLHWLPFGIVGVLLEMALLQILRRYRPRLEIRLLLIQFLHVVRVS